MQIKDFLKQQLPIAYEKMKDTEILVGLGGTITTVVALEYNIYPYDSKKVHGSKLTYEAITKWLNKLASMTVNQRKAIPMIEDKRAEAIVPGIVIFQTAMEVFQKDEITVSEWGVRHGLLLELTQNWN
jgi:exopolyphosphatase/guanosine-5'-triphosphate,3'-diphosphate pyrophosphatase